MVSGTVLLENPAAAGMHQSHLLLELKLEAHTADDTITMQQQLAFRLALRSIHETSMQAIQEVAARGFIVERLVTGLIRISIGVLVHCPAVPLYKPD